MEEGPNLWNMSFENVLFQKEFQNLLAHPIITWIHWLTKVFIACTSSQRQVFSCTQWALWSERNKQVHEISKKSSKEIFHFIQNYIKKLDGVEEKVLTRKVDTPKWEAPLGD